MNDTILDSRHYQAADRLPGGSQVYLRAIQPDDKQALQAALASYSSESSYQRFLGIKKSFTDAELVAYTEPDFIHHVALVCELEVNGQRVPVGIGRYFTTDADPSPTAEVSFAVSDDYQHRGIGPVLLRHLLRIAASAGITKISAWVLAQNRGMLSVFRNAPEPSSFRYHDNLIEATLELN